MSMMMTTMMLPRNPPNLSKQWAGWRGVHRTKLLTKNEENFWSELWFVQNRVETGLSDTRTPHPLLNRPCTLLGKDTLGSEITRPGYSDKNFGQCFCLAQIGLRPWDQWLSDTITPRPSPIDRVFCWEMTPSALQRTRPGYSDTAAKLFMHLHPQNEGRPRSSPHRQINRWEKLNLLHIICLQKSQLPRPIWQSLQLMEQKDRFPNNVFFLIF